VEIVEGSIGERVPVAQRASASNFALPFGLALVAVVLTFWTIDIVSPALPDIQEDLGLSAAETGLVFSLLFLGRLIGNFPASWLLPRFGTAGTAIAGGFILVLGTAAAANAPNGLTLNSVRIVQGIGVAFLVNACLRAILGSKPGRGDAMTYFGFAATVGGVFGLQSGGYLTEERGWRAIFVLSIVLGAIITATALVSRIVSARRGGPFDPTPADTSRETASRNGMLLPLILNFLVFFNYSLFVALPLYTEHEFGTSAEANARLLMVITVVHLLAAFPAGRVIRGWGAQPVLIAGMVVSLIGTGLILPMPDPIWIAVPLVLYGAGQVSAMNAGGDIVLHLGGQSTRSVSLVRFTTDLGLVTGPYLTGTLSDAFGYGAPFIALPAMMVVATLVAIWRFHAASDQVILSAG
jgi:DHA1 family bicyclomycin/chloramphenicol resistance-like MFS transporter